MERPELVIGQCNAPSVYGAQCALEKPQLQCYSESDEKVLCYVACRLQHTSSLCIFAVLRFQNYEVNLNVKTLYCIVLYREFLEWPKYKLQGPREKQDELINS